MKDMKECGASDKEVPCANQDCRHAKLNHAAGSGNCSGIIPVPNKDGQMIENPCHCQGFVYDDQIFCANCGHTHECHQHGACIGRKLSDDSKATSTCGCIEFKPIALTEFIADLSKQKVD